MHLACLAAAVPTNTLCGVQLVCLVENILALATLDIALGPYVDWLGSWSRSRSRGSGLSGFRHFVDTD